MTKTEPKPIQKPSASVKETIKSVEDFLRLTPEKEISDNFIAHVDHLCKQARLSKAIYWDSIARQSVERQILFSTDRKIIWKLVFDDVKLMWIYKAFDTKDEIKNMLTNAQK